MPPLSPPSSGAEHLGAAFSTDGPRCIPTKPHWIKVPALNPSKNIGQPRPADPNLWRQQAFSCKLLQVSLALLCEGSRGFPRPILFPRPRMALPVWWKRRAFPVGEAPILLHSIVSHTVKGQFYLVSQTEWANFLACFGGNRRI